MMQSFLWSCIKNHTDLFKKQNFTYLVPAPSSKEIIRYFSKQMSKQFQIPAIPVFKKTKKQQNKKLDQFSRYHEVQNNIILNPDKKISINNETKILVFDDLWTTGATMNHLCKLLVDHGVKPEQIDCVVLFIRPKINADFSCRRDAVSSVRASNA
jgi:predicted amidophosphoribosyltransferase